MRSCKNLNEQTVRLHTELDNFGAKHDHINIAIRRSMEIDDVLYKFVNDEVVPGTRKSADEVFGILGELVVQFGPKNQILLDKRGPVSQRLTNTT
ncbi:MAG: hypothetical protein CM1200mP27_02500 [Chloroflexota bacterium]|nr:MAG: hypothetical protein CM1200mP27_02500 [Chloroflexota bacterium]